MSGGGPSRLLLVLMGIVPLVVLVAVVVAFFLVRAGFGLLVGAGVPFLLATLAIVVMSVLLGRAASGSGGETSDPPDGESKEGNGRSHGHDGV